MKRNLLRIAMLSLLCVLAGQNIKATPVNQKNIYLTVEADPSVAGVVYADVKPAYKNYAKDKTEWVTTSSEFIMH